MSTITEEKTIEKKYEPISRVKLSKLHRDNSDLLKEEIFNIVEKEGVRYIKLQFTDVTGVIKAVTIPVGKLKDAIEQNVWFDGSSIEGFTRIFESDMYLKLDLSTFTIIPWSREKGKVTARFICDVYTPNGNPFEGDPRYILKKQMARAERLGYTFYTGPELEFFLFKKNDGDIKPLPHDKGGYFDLSTDLAVEIRKEITDALLELGIDVETLHHEVAQGQHEINFKYSDALTCADNTVTFKTAVRAVAQKYGLYATFMPKPVAGINGSGMHVNQSLFKDDSNAFFDENHNIKLSKIALNFIAGQLKNIGAITAIANPTVNSYKRLVAGYEAPVYVAWGQTNRSALIRIPRYTKGRESATRCEFRSPDPSSNPYLAFAVMLAAGLDGIENNLTPPDPVNEDIFHLDDKKAKELKIRHLPDNMWEAIKDLEKNGVIKDALGEHIFNAFTKAKRAEWLDYKTYVSQWEHDKYFVL
ncbi:glutamine synthetase [bacterium]|nr:glutamine synthetase [bacterium]